MNNYFNKYDPSDSPSASYDRIPVCENILREKDVMIPMRDGISVCGDIYRPDMNEPVPALLSFGIHNKELLGPDMFHNVPTQPAWSTLWIGNIEGGDTTYFVTRGYAHVVVNPRNVGKSEDGPFAMTDQYDTIEWIAKQPWCDGNVGMIGISNFAANQFMAAATQPPHLKAIFPFDPAGAYGGPMSFRDVKPGGVLPMMDYVMDLLDVGHSQQKNPGELSEPMKQWWEEAMENPDYRMYGHVYNILTMKGQKNPHLFQSLINPYDNPESTKAGEENFKRIQIPAYTGSGWYAYTYKAHIQGAQHWYHGIDVPKKLVFTGPAHMERPFHSLREEMLRWYDYWLKGIKTGIMEEAAVKYWVMGSNQWRTGEDWPLPETQWTKYYLDSWERLRTKEFNPYGSDAYEQPDAFLQMPPTQTNEISKLRYMTEPLAEDTLVAGPISLNFYASIDQEDTNWIVILKDVGPDESVRTGREGEKEIPKDLPEREVTRGWLKASHRAIDAQRSKAWEPWHLYTREAQQKIVPGEINEYNVEILATANCFKKGHRICLEITSMDMATGTGGLFNAEYIPYHICSSKTTVHKIYRNAKYSSHLLLPIIPLNEAIE
ncbi:Cocaine esterase [uncultured Roseburia sp.]|uniref:CocE/NonD family hydrolase n=1 Tax=Brotonthovivens ammoniilytica TaxID=2981725 RepID=A0ABT2TF94_9FIRM|nr:CocE/NonD family hydrolase [Brotonthovivens ammoniilytica]MCU6760854.1 CocE/NonD family hydrolase [Brotonthovivens ammoniilytica]SCI11279.1 Cocaine esterase [uncultured Roseburia sp.]